MQEQQAEQLTSAEAVPQVIGPKRDTQGKNWCFTWNNYADKEAPKSWPNVAYLVYQCEVCPHTGTPHLQGYVRFSNNPRFSWVAKLAKGIHWEQRRGTHQQARDYCRKADSRAPGPDSGPWVVGDEPEPGRRTDLDRAAEMIRSGASVRTLAAEMPETVIRYSRGLKEYKMVITEPRSHDTELVILWGPPGTGKSHTASTQWPEAYWVSRGNGQALWWDNYAGEKIVILDEFTGWMTKDIFCRLVDKNQFMVDTKGGRVPFVAELIVCTSNKDPWTWWEAPLYGVQRRLEEATIIKMDKPVPPEVHTKKRTYGEALLAQGLQAEEREAPEHPLWVNTRQHSAIPETDSAPRVCGSSTDIVTTAQGAYAAGFAPSSTTGYAGVRSCLETGCEAHWILKGGYCIQHSDMQ